VILTSYGLLRRDIAALEKIRFQAVVFDEIQAIKNAATQAYRAAENLDARIKLGLTGTPIENSIIDLKALMDLTTPGYLGTTEAFERRYVAPIKQDIKSRRRKELSRLISPFTLRRLKKTVLTDLPAKIENQMTCRLSDDQVKLYQDALASRGAGLLDVLGQEDEPIPYLHVFALLNMLKQICNHPVLLEKEVDTYARYGSGKWDLFQEILTQSLESGQKVVVYSQYLKMIDIIGRHLKQAKIEHVTLTGASRNRGRLIARFNDDPDCRVFVGSLKAGGTGIDLVAASVVIHYDRWWNAAREDQATDRVHRIGQKKGVHIFKLVTEGTLEEKIAVIIEKKKKIMDAVMQEDDPGLLKTFSREDLMEMLSIPVLPPLSA
jgi:SNF2 family DNA or RNA helicase